MIFEQLGAVEGKKVTIWNLVWDNWISPFVSCPWCSAFLFVLVGQLVGWFWMPLFIALAVAFTVKLFVTIFEKWMMK